MKITDVRALPTWTGDRNLLLVTVDTDAGICGVGEAGLTGRELAVCGAVEHLRPLLVGADPVRTEHLWQVLTRGGFFPAQRVLMAAISAIDIALADIKGKAWGVPVHELLGGRVRDHVPCYGHVTIPPGHGPDDVAHLCRNRIDEGWRALRFGLPTCVGEFDARSAVAETVERVAAARDAVGEHIELIVDAHTRLDPPEARWLCRELEPYHPLFIEDPVRCENLGAYRRLRDQTSVPLAAGEQLCSKWEFQPLIDGQLVDYARLDLCLVGGFTEACKIAAWCETHHVRVAVHNPLGPVATAAAAHFNVACTPFGIQEQPVLPSADTPDAFSSTVQWRDGALFVSAAPGLGVDLDRDAALASPPRWTEPPHLRRPDGSYTNW